MSQQVTDAPAPAPVRCRHVWVAGMMYVHDEDVESVAAVRPVECERCEVPFSPGMQYADE
jgi:hypothetical protein